jgi:iron complex outermembrane receptor protein
MRTFSLAAPFAVAVLLTVGFSFGTAGQTTQTPSRVTGTVVDRESGAPLTAARVSLLPTHLGETTHAQGRFLFDNLTAGTYTLVVEHLGYRRVSRPVVVASSGATDVRVEMEIAAIELGAIVVTGALTRRSREDVLSPITTLAGAELDRRMDATVAAALEGKPGLATTSLGPATARPVIRGLGGDRIVMLEDGHRSGDLSSYSSDHAVTIDPLTARQVEVVRGPMSLLYGSSALGGVVNVIREEIPASLPEHTHGGLSLQGASVNDGLTAGGYALTSLGQFALRGEASVRRSGDVKTPLGDLVNTGTNAFNLAAGAGVAPDWGHAGIAYRLFDTKYGIPGGFVGGHEGGVDIEMRRHSVRAVSELHRESALFHTFRATGAYTDYHHVELEQSGAVGTEFFQDIANLEIVSNHGAHGTFTEGAVGVRAQYRDVVTGGSLRTPSTYDYTLAIFGVEELVTGPFRFQAGLRYDLARYVPRDTTAFVSAGGERIPVRARSFGSVSASSGVLWVASDLIRFGASIARAYRTPDFNELFSNGPHLAANSFDVGDPRIEQETGFGLDVFARITHDRMNGEIAAFRNQLSDYIFPSSRGRAELGAQGGRPRFQYTNEDARFTGIEGEFDFSVSNAVVVEATGSVVQAEFTSERAPIPILTPTDTMFVPASKYPPLIPPPQARLGARYEQPGHFAGFGVKLVAEQDRLGDFETRSPAYALLDVSVGVRLVRGDRLHTLTLRIDNALDTRYRDHLSRIKDLMPGPGRGFSLLYRLAF